MTSDEAARFIGPAIAPATGAWADLGAGEGTFTRALSALLEPDARILAVDRDAAALRRLADASGASSAARAGGRRRGHDGRSAVSEIQTVVADFRRPAEVAGLPPDGLAGALFANALHFDSRPEATLAAWAARVRPGGRIVVVEYDRRAADAWVPHPVGLARLEDAAEGAGLAPPRLVAERPSSYGGVMYCAWLGVRVEA